MVTLSLLFCTIAATLVGEGSMWRSGQRHNKGKKPWFCCRSRLTSDQASGDASGAQFATPAQNEMASQVSHICQYVVPGPLGI